MRILCVTAFATIGASLLVGFGLDERAAGRSEGLQKTSDAKPSETVGGDANDGRKGRYATVNGLKMYYEIHGTGKPLVLLHGAFGWATVSCKGQRS
jgi:hypothetical protein